MRDGVGQLMMRVSDHQRHRKLGNICDFRLGMISWEFRDAVITATAHGICREVHFLPCITAQVEDAATGSKPRVYTASQQNQCATAPSTQCIGRLPLVEQTQKNALKQQFSQPLGPLAVDSIIIPLTLTPVPWEQ